MNEKDTIVAISTPQGNGAMAIVRMSGSKAFIITHKLTKKNNFSPRYATLCSIYNDFDELIDEAIVIYFKAPFSYTREDVCEIQCHGGLISAKMILEACLKAGARLANAGEFSKRAFLNGRIDFSQVSALAKLIEAKSQNAAKVLVRQLKGELGNFVEETRESLLRLLAYSEVMIDYSEEDIPSDMSVGILSQLETIMGRLQGIYEFSSMRQGMVDGYRLSIIGKPNVGKSSVLNAILLYDRAITSPIAGTTRDTIEESIQIEGNIVKIIDTAGIRGTKDSIEALGIQKSIQAARESDMILAIFDASTKSDKDDKDILNLLNEFPDKRCIIAFNKNDLPAVLDFKEIEKSLKIPYQSISINAKDSQKCALKLKEIFSSILKQDEIGEEILLTSVFQIQAIEKTIKSIQEAINVFESRELELFSYNISDALEAISSITHPYDISEMFDKMFGEFCLGK
ncbi:tRNA uridine-5-carboxymethylaminomethyl(34) synthesis GTPase MnmE [Helicobacter sp. 12S02232-10]|uniref:tRNA uridine-5-carboxymethylaminomethyl(34) synthesis GTPase MnmE n=1 Tax=Helicobacter sp. 12S02232-10 TaxID=1476197 RepID=UPI000BA52D60|nr:tRNA uridine-5-carboxymethylaminomethyl(34) synthesis GTPase MnmE [Helicobacter sp. 12S02232-10]PAF49175.1 tRNA uridine-5-carboxymethylaminomethyl(34) synthesis GTPase MnmE [Helicobacter sp. 12S02232-10]